jgi:hypothetical protein
MLQQILSLLKFPLSIQVRDISSTISREILILPVFLVSHLSATSVSDLAVQLCAPNSFIHTSEYPADFSLGFGPHIRLDVSPFDPRDKQSLRSFQKRDGNDNLDVVNSLPIALNLVSLESTAEILNDWLDGIINSPSIRKSFASSSLLVYIFRQDHLDIDDAKGTAVGIRA